MGVAFRLALALVVAFLHGDAVAQHAPPLSDAQVRQEIIQQSVSAYFATGHPCACPYNMMRNGRSCGGGSACRRPGGAAPICYPQDVS